jgi:hypothetical protein
MKRDEILAEMFAEISNVLYKKDPANTSCVENEVIDEYDAEAALIVDLFDESREMSLGYVENIFNTRFEGSYSPEALKEAWPTIKRVLYSAEI